MKCLLTLYSKRTNNYNKQRTPMNQKERNKEYNVKMNK